MASNGNIGDTLEERERLWRKLEARGVRRAGRVELSPGFPPAVKRAVLEDLEAERGPPPGGMERPNVERLLRLDSESLDARKFSVRTADKADHDAFMERLEAARLRDPGPETRSALGDVPAPGAWPAGVGLGSARGAAVVIADDATPEVRGHITAHAKTPEEARALGLRTLDWQDWMTGGQARGPGPPDDKRRRRRHRRAPAPSPRTRARRARPGRHGRHGTRRHRTVRPGRAPGHQARRPRLVAPALGRRIAVAGTRKPNALEPVSRRGSVGHPRRRELLPPRADRGPESARGDDAPGGRSRAPRPTGTRAHERPRTPGAKDAPPTPWSARLAPDAVHNPAPDRHRARPRARHPRPRGRAPRMVLKEPQRPRVARRHPRVGSRERRPQLARPRRLLERRRRAPGKRRRPDVRGRRETPQTERVHPHPVGEGTAQRTQAQRPHPGVAARHRRAPEYAARRPRSGQGLRPPELRRNGRRPGGGRAPWAGALPPQARRHDARDGPTSRRLDRREGGAHRAPAARRSGSKDARGGA